MSRPKNFTKCSVCKKSKAKAKKLPYGAKRKRVWCSCDRNHVAPVNKKAARQEAKTEIFLNLDEATIDKIINETLAEDPWEFK